MPDNDPKEQEPIPAPQPTTSDDDTPSRIPTERVNESKVPPEDSGKQILED